MRDISVVWRGTMLAFMVGSATMPGAALSQTASSVPAVPAAPSVADTADGAVRFGSLEAVQQISLSPNGERVAFIAPAAGLRNELFVVATTEGARPQRILVASGAPEQLHWCAWESDDRLICEIGGRRQVGDDVQGFERLVALDPDGGNVIVLGAAGSRTRYGGGLIDWLPAEPGQILMTMPSGSVDRVDVRTNQNRTLYPARDIPAAYLTDGNGTIRVMVTQQVVADAQLVGTQRFYYRMQGSTDWRPMSASSVLASDGFRPAMVDGPGNRVIGFQKIDGRDAVLAYPLDGSDVPQTVYAHPEVDVDDLVRIGAQRRFVGVSFATERRQTAYFDPAVERQAASLSRALGGRQVHVIASSDNDSRLLIWAGSDVDAGTYYLFTPATRQLRPLLVERPQLAAVTLSPVRPITFTAADGTSIPGYLTLPPGRTDARGLPAVVMPHGGPSARDEWGFDWLSQYLAQQGYAVLQPNFRGSSGYGDAWYQHNGFQSWRTAIGDVTDGGRWLVADQGVDAARLSIVGWSYGGYAALQSAVLAPGLFRSVVAVAHVTDLAALRRDAQRYVTGDIQRDFIGVGPHVREGSPAQNAASITVPVLMFHGTLDTNVAVEQSRIMQRELLRARRSVELVEYPGLEHSLMTGEARQDMLRRITAFLPH
jgi:dipeptidyl aminopeptidase/acylaminoacyl peptidase